MWDPVEAAVYGKGCKPIKYNCTAKFNADTVVHTRALLTQTLWPCRTLPIHRSNRQPHHRKLIPWTIGCYTDPKIWFKKRGRKIIVASPVWDQQIKYFWKPYLVGTATVEYLRMPCRPTSAHPEETCPKENPWTAAGKSAKEAIANICRYTCILIVAFYFSKYCSSYGNYPRVEYLVVWSRVC